MVNSLPSKTVPRAPETGICVPVAERMGQNSYQLALDNTRKISFGFYALHTQSHWVWDPVGHILGWPAKSFAHFIILPLCRKRTLVGQEFLTSKNCLKQPLAFRPDSVNTAVQVGPLPSYPQPVLLIREVLAHTAGLYYPSARPSTHFGSCIQSPYSREVGGWG